MGVFEQFPYVNFHELNLDWVLDKIKELQNVIETHIIDPVARAMATQNAQDISDLTTTVANNKTTAHNESQAAYNNAMASLHEFEKEFTIPANTTLALNVTAGTIAVFFAVGDLVSREGVFAIHCKSNTEVVLTEYVAHGINMIPTVDNDQPGKVFVENATSGSGSIWLCCLTFQGNVSST